MAYPSDRAMLESARSVIRFGCVSIVNQEKNMKSTFACQTVALTVAGLGLAAVAGTAFAQQASPAQALLDNAWVFNFGAFVVGSDLTAALNGQSSNNPAIDFDDTFGRADDATRIRAEALWRITPAHHLRLMYFDNKNDRSKIIDRDIKWGDYTFKANGKVDLGYKHEVIAFGYEWAFMRAPSYEIAATLGVHYSETTLKLSGNATRTNPDGTVTNVSAATQSSTLPAPLPMVGLRGGWVVAPQWYIDVEAQFFQVRVNGYDGRWSDIRVGATWMFSKGFGLGLGYNRFSSDLDVTRNDFNGKLNTGYSGLQAYLTGTF